MEILGVSICATILTISAVIWRILSLSKKQKDRFEEIQKNEWEAFEQVDHARDIDITDPIDRLRSARRLRDKK